MKYPVILTETATNILVEVPDLGILTEANEEGKPKGTVEDAIMMAQDAIELSLKDNLIEPSELSNIDITKGTFYEYGTSTLVLVEV